MFNDEGKISRLTSRNHLRVRNHKSPITNLGLLTGVIVVCGIVFAVHKPALSARAVSFDDEQYLFENHLVQNPSFKSAVRFLSEVLRPSTVRGYYQPLTMISLMLDYAMGGRADNLTVFHLTSLCLHLANTALIILLLYMLFGQFWPAAIAGLLFGVHPMTVEPIPWIGERKTLLASFFALWSIIIYLRYTHTGNWRNYILCIVMYILSLMAKPTTTPLPVLFVLLDFWPLNRLSNRTLQEKIPPFIIMLVFAFITVISQSRSANVTMPSEYSPVRILLILCHNIIFYLYKIILPINLSSHYPFPDPLNLSDKMVLAGVIGTCVLIPALLISLRRTRVFLTGWLFFFIAIFPTMGVIGFTNVVASDKYTYLPSLGLLIILAWLLSRLWMRLSALPAYRIVIVVFVLLLATSEALATRYYLKNWKDTDTLYRYMLSLSPNVSVLRNNYGAYLYKNGQLNQAIEQFEQAIRLMPKNFAALSNMGIVYCIKGQLKKAVSCWIDTLRLQPDWGDALNNLAWLKATQKDPNFRNPDAAMQMALRACKLTDYAKPEYLDTLAVAYAAAGRFDQAIETAQKAIKQAETAANKKLAAEIKNRLRLYQAGQMYFEGG